VEPTPMTRLEHAHVLGMPVTTGRWGDILAAIDSVIRERDAGHYVSVTNTESMYHALRIPEHYTFIRGADISVCDGVGVSLVGRVSGLRIPRRHGPILQLACCAYGEPRGWRHFFYGGKEGVAEMLVAQLTARYPGLVCAGTYTPPFRELDSNEDERVTALINEARPDIVWVGLGLLKQERWIAQHLGRVDAPWMIGVGATFDYHAGVVPWAPGWIRAAGLEWLFRLVLQPRLRARRYWWSLRLVVEGIMAGVRSRLAGTQSRSN
jgi:N-acetylglucosaminyldiphosphoundecaprenol N-acetyl-beta-D-mannosaminyltransferase